MPNWNGLAVSVEAHRIATRIREQIGLDTIPEGYNVSAVKSQLRNLYVATGGKRGPAAKFDPTTSQLRTVYNGVQSGASIYAEATSGTVPEAPVKATPAPVVVDAAPEDAAIAALKTLLGGQKLDPEQVRAIAVDAVNGRVAEVMTSMGALIAEQVEKSVRRVEVKIADLPEVKFDTHHKAFPKVLRYAANRQSIMLVGPAGSGKTRMAEDVATALGLEFYFQGKCADEVKITGYMDAGGTYRTTPFRTAFEFGGVFLFDEIDGWTADAVIAVNAPLAGKWGDFPDGKVARHPDFVAIGAANTYGRGADRQYVGREQLDAATLDRFAVIEVDYDEELELAISSNADWTKYVQKVRSAIAKEKVRHVVSPRASIGGGIMLAAGEARPDVEEAYVWKGMEEVVRNRIKASMR